MSYSETIDNRMFDFQKFYKKIALQLPNGCRIAEVGVGDGASSIFLAEELKSLRKDFTLYMIDSLDYGNKQQLSTIIFNVMKSGLFDNIEIMPFDSLNASLMFNDNSLDFVFLDSGHTYELTKAEIKLWYDKLKDGGILAGHDFFSKENKGVGQAVKELIPETITRHPIINETVNDKEEIVVALDKFVPEQLLFTEQTEHGNGIWYLYKKFYFKPTI